MVKTIAKYVFYRYYNLRFRNIHLISYKMKTSLLEKYSFIKHLLLWLGAWLFFIVFFSYNSHNLYYNLTFSTILLLITAITTYTVAYYLIPKYLWEKKYILFGVYTFSTMLFTTFCTILLLMLSITYIP